MSIISRVILLSLLLAGSATGQVVVSGGGGGVSDVSVVNPISFGAKFDGKAFFSNVNTCSFTNATATFTCTGANLCNGTTVPCTAGQTSDVGKQFTATTGSCCGGNFNFQGTLAMANVATTIISVQSATAATISQNFTATSGANWIIAWGTNDDTAISAAETVWASGNKCRTMQLPAGITALLQPHFSNPGANCLGMEPQADYTAAVNGQGIGSTVIGLFAGFNLAGCTAGPSSNVCFGGYKENVFNNFQLNGFGWGNTGSGALKHLLFAGLGSQWNQVACNAFGGSDSNLNGLTTDIGARLWGISIDGCGGGGGSSAGLNIIGGIVKVYYSFIGDNAGFNVFISSGSDLTDFGSDYGPTNGFTSMRVDGRFHGVGSEFFGSTASSGTLLNQSSGANSVVILDGARVNNTALTSNGIAMNGASQRLYLKSGTHVGGTTAAIAPTLGTIFMDPDTVLDAGLITGAAATILVADGHALKGTCTGVGTPASTLGLYGTGPNVVLTTCTSVVIGSGIPISGPRTALRLTATATAAGTNASSGVVTVLKNAVATTLTCTIGTGTSCIDTTHSVSFADGDLISIQFTTQAADTLAGVKAQVSWF